MRGPCACPGWGATCLLHAVPTGSRCHQDKHKAPTLPHIRPLSLQDPMRSSTFIRGTRSHPHHRATIGTYPSCQRCCAASAAHSGKTQGARPTLPHSTTLAPTDHPASCLSSRLSLMPFSSRCSIAYLATLLRSVSGLARKIEPVFLQRWPRPKDVTTHSTMTRAVVY